MIQSKNINKEVLCTIMWLDFAIILMMIFCAYIDIKMRIIPNKLCLSVLLISVLKAFYIIIINFNNNFKCTNFILSLFLGGLISLLFLGIPFFANNSIGGGDLKLSCCLGLYFGFTATISLLFIAFVSCAFCAIFINIYKHITKKPKVKTLPFAPFLLIGLLYILFIKYFY